MNIEHGVHVWAPTRAYGPRGLICRVKCMHSLTSHDGVDLRQFYRNYFTSSSLAFALIVGDSGLLSSPLPLGHEARWGTLQQ